MKLFKLLVLSFCLIFASVVVASCAFNSKEYEATDSSYFVFTQIDGGYSISAKDIGNLPSDLVIPKEYEDKPIVEIANSGFYNGSFKSVKIPSSVKTVGAVAFSNCSKLEKVILLNGVINIGDYAFYSCNMLYSCELPESLVSIGKNAFASTRLSDVDLLKNVKTVGEKAFKDCQSLASVYVGMNVEIIADDAFLNCSENIKFTLSSSNVYFELVDGKPVNRLNG